MSEFKNVTAIKEANIYFDGKVTSRTLVFPDGSKKTLGIMFPGTYEFTTAEREIMEILSGQLDVLISDDEGWKNIKSGEQFDVPAATKFHLNVMSITDYCCSYSK
jgi:purine/pyrimidine-nucleoside phosphorylase